MRGRPDEALRRTCGRPGDSWARAASRSSPRRWLYIEAEAARAARRPRRRRRRWSATASPRSRAWSARYAWPLIWLGTRIDADAAELGARPARAGGRPGGRTDQESRPRGRPRSSSPAAAAYRAMAHAEDAAPRRRARRRSPGRRRRRLGAGDRRLAAGLRPVPAGRGAVRGRRPRDRGRPARATAAAAAPAHGRAAAARRRAGAGPPGPARRSTRRRPGARAVGSAAPFGLTDREREVLSLVAAGRSNGQIATALFISPKTASVHVSNILAKLGVSGRVEAAAVAHRNGLVEATGRAVATWDDVAGCLHRAARDDRVDPRRRPPAWRVQDKLFVWERPLRRGPRRAGRGRARPARCWARACPTRARSRR